MKVFLVVLISFLSLGCISNSEEATTSDVNSDDRQTEQMSTYYFIRHAEKDLSDPQNSDPELTAAGNERAAGWAEVFKEVAFDHIFSSDYKRTRQTANAIARSQNKQVEIYDAGKLNDSEFQETTKGKTVLVVGHSNTNPAFVNYILEEKKYQDIDDKESGSLFIISVAPDGTKSSQVLYIN